ncbi:tagaturonate reductase [Mucilaginibacter arboris]|uniref:Tagaturonate reductase n=1 Tax=Mucilaginibacter arboris TaxID=2682090 RepID=A0A7K1SRY5_9SPHI|nr:tagaturonate reductase [Mucilaginibacter arboris]MVN20075.1 tagaturonate reductase [Mucilaginibacter arboris]
MILSKSNLKEIQSQEVIVPDEAILSLPEKVLQFGTGVLLRGLPDYFIDKANREGVFNGRIVVVKSTSTGSSSEFDDQDGLYTLCVKGIENGQKIEENIICSAISRVLSAGEHWEEILKCAQKPEMKIVISNTTEVGIQLVKEDIKLSPPTSFPGKLLAFLVERYKAFNGSEESGMVIVPTELIVGNGDKLKSIVLELAAFNQLDAALIDWLDKSNSFCNSLVDRIVPGKPDAETVSAFQEKAGYEDKLLTVSEVYRLWAIEGNEKVKAVLSFAEADKGVIIAPDIEIYRELKLRMLNGTHTLSCGLAFLAGFNTVKEAMDDETFSSFVSELMKEEIASSIPYEVSKQQTDGFAGQVLDRFRNPHIKHQWIAITVQFSAKLKMRVVPVLVKHYQKSDQIPARIALGFAAYIAFMQVQKEENGKFYGGVNGKSYPVNDDQARFFYDLKNSIPADILTYTILNNTELWGTDLTLLPGFEDAVQQYFAKITSEGALKAAEGLSVKNKI